MTGGEKVALGNFVQNSAKPHPRLASAMNLQYYFIYILDQLEIDHVINSCLPQPKNTVQLAMRPR